MTGPSAAPGPLGDEARLLVEAAQAWAGRLVPDDHAATCQWCPLCRTVTALRDPELADRLATGLSRAATGLAGLLDALTEPPPPPSTQDIPVD